MNQIPGDLQYLPGTVLFSHFVKEFDNISEVHVSVQDDVPVVFDKSQSYKEVEMHWCHFAAGPDCLPDKVDFAVGEFTFEVQEKPSVKEKY